MARIVQGNGIKEGGFKLAASMPVNTPSIRLMLTVELLVVKDYVNYTFLMLPSAYPE
jgi:hypothetical protein